MPAKKNIHLSKRSVLQLYRSGLHSIRGIAERLDAYTEEGRKRIRTILEAEGYRPKRYRWTEDEVRLLRKLYPHVDAKIIARKLKRPVCSIYGKVHKLQLKKSAKWWKDKRAYWAKLLQRKGRPYRFKEGHVTWNEGLKGLKFPGSEKGQFKKGQRSVRWNGYRNGMIVIIRDKTGRLYKRIRLRPGKWEYYQRYLWKKHRGPIPRGKLVVFKNRNSMDCRLSNLILIDRKEHGKRWSHTDGGIAKALATESGRKGKINYELFWKLLNDSGLLDAKRRQLELERMIHAHRQ